MADPYDHMRRIASAAVAYLHACRCHSRRDPAAERAVLLAMVAAMGGHDIHDIHEGDDD